MEHQISGLATDLARAGYIIEFTGGVLLADRILVLIVGRESGEGIFSSVTRWFCNQAMRIYAQAKLNYAGKGFVVNRLLYLHRLSSGNWLSYDPFPELKSWLTFLAIFPFIFLLSFTGVARYSYSGSEIISRPFRQHLLLRSLAFIAQFLVASVFTILFIIAQTMSVFLVSLWVAIALLVLLVIPRARRNSKSLIVAGSLMVGVGLILLFVATYI